MSTTFGILKYGLDKNKIFDENGEIYPYIDEDYCFTAVFFRGSYNRWILDLASHLPDDTKVYPLDNSAQGIYTIGDCRKYLEEEKNKEL
jgi:hypothetical protein